MKELLLGPRQSRRPEWPSSRDRLVGVFQTSLPSEDFKRREEPPFLSSNYDNENLFVEDWSGAKSERV